MTISVGDVNDAPVFAAATATRSVPENSGSGVDVGTVVTATDQDGDSLTQSISGAGEFSIVPSSGQIRVAAGAVLDFEASPSHSVTVTGRDPGGLFASTRVTIQMNDVYENVLPAFWEEQDPAIRAVVENSPPGTNVGAPVMATDEGDTVTHSLGGPDGRSHGTNLTRRSPIAGLVSLHCDNNPSEITCWVNPRYRTLGD